MFISLLQLDLLAMLEQHGLPLLLLYGLYRLAMLAIPELVRASKAAITKGLEMLKEFLQGLNLKLDSIDAKVDSVDSKVDAVQRDLASGCQRGIGNDS